jgi:Spy/CpxP family protein refolding chaperone
MRGLTCGPVADELGLTDAQREKIRAKAEKLEAELRQKLAEMRAQAQAELLKELTPQQQAKIKEMYGEPFEFRRDEPQFGRGGPGAPGGPGGAAATDQQGRGARPGRGN